MVLLIIDGILDLSEYRAWIEDQEVRELWMQHRSKRKLGKWGRKWQR